MKNSRRRGATLGLVAVLSLTIGLVGVGLFFLAKLVGGHRELEHATDSGNLNVAKQSVRSPFLRVFGNGGNFDIADAAILEAVQRNFSELADPSNGQIDLLVYDRLVAQTFLVALNAAADNGGVNPNPLGIIRARQLIQVLNDPANGVGVSLARKLKGDSALDLNFSALAAQNNVRMFRPNQQTQPVTNVKDISFMVRGAPSNVVLNPAVLPPPFNQGNLAGNFFVKNGTPYFVGYVPLTVPNVTDNNTNAIMAVPLRPGERPHLVDGITFNQLQPSPLPGPDGQVRTRIPPNAFQSGGLAFDGRTVLMQSAVSCAIAGSLNATFPLQILNGYIAVANGPGVEPTGPPGPIGFSSPGPQCINANLTEGMTSDVFSGVLMTGVWEIAAPGANGGVAISTDINCIPFIENLLWLRQQYGVDNAAQVQQASLCLSGTTKYDDAIHIAPRQTNGNPGASAQHRCTNKNSTPGTFALAGVPQDTLCEAGLAKVQSIYGGLGGGTTTPLCLSALEYMEATIMSDRANSGHSHINPFNSCTGLQAFPLDFDSFSINSIQKNPPTINQLIGPTGTLVRLGSSSMPGGGAVALNATRAYNAVIAKMLQMKPTASMTEIQNIFNQTIPMGSVNYIFLDNSNQSNPQFRFTTAAGLPPRIDPTSVIVDGTPINAFTPGYALVVSGMFEQDGYLDQGGDGGYPSPYDCAPFGQGTSTSGARFTPNSGVDALLGVLRFTNCVNTGGGMDFDCPC